MRDGPWKLITKMRGNPSQSPLLFNVAEDISEEKDISTEHPERVAKMSQALEAWKKDVAKATPQPDVPEEPDKTKKN